MLVWVVGEWSDDGLVWLVVVVVVGRRSGGDLGGGGGLVWVVGTAVAHPNTQVVTVA